MGKNSKARDAEQRRQYQEARRREELERQKRQDRLMWQIVIGVAAVVVVIAAISVAISMIAKGQKANLATILKEIQQRDYQDTHREIAPLKQAKDAVKVDTSDLDIEGVVAAIRAIVEQKIGL
jgi:ABC-type Fe3+ transport system permease subunit